jgi:hypothetical protein
VEFNHEACERRADGDRMGTGANDPNPSEMARAAKGRGKEQPPAHHNHTHYRPIRRNRHRKGEESIPASEVTVTTLSTAEPFMAAVNNASNSLPCRP